MNKLIVSVVVMFVMALVLSFLVHGVLLNGDYTQLQSWMRPQADAQSLVAYIIIAQALFGAAFAWIYVQGAKTSLGWRKASATVSPLRRSPSRRPI
jgi:hypothetical protein